MTLICNECTLIDKENQIIELAFSVEKQVLAIIKFDYKNDNVDINGDLYNLIGWEDTKEDKEKYNNFLNACKTYGKCILENYK